MAPAPKRYRVVPPEDGMMLFQFVMRRVRCDAPAAKDLVRAGGVYMGKVRVRLPQVRVALGERISIYREAGTADNLDPAALRFVHRDEHCVVVDKAAGVPVAATRATARGTLAQALIAYLEAEGVHRPYVGVVHRLDQGASGLVLFTVRSAANKSLHQQFEAHTVDRRYRARVLGAPEPAWTVDAPIRASKSGTVFVGEHPRARTARTDFTTLCRGTEHSLVEACLHTGRTHQIRAHAGHCGHPLVGDHRYRPDEGAPTPTALGLEDRLHLHAHRLAFDHPISGARHEFESEAPPWAQPDGA